MLYCGAERIADLHAGASFGGQEEHAVALAKKKTDARVDVEQADMPLLAVRFPAAQGRVEPLKHLRIDAVPIVRDAQYQIAVPGKNIHVNALFAAAGMDEGMLVAVFEHRLQGELEHPLAEQRVVHLPAHPRPGKADVHQ